MDGRSVYRPSRTNGWASIDRSPARAKSAPITCASSLTAQVAEQANQGYKTKEGRANVAKVLSAADRDQKQKPKELVEAMSLKPGMVVADIGTGVGYMLPFLSEAVGPGGRVLA